jgi:hypothetical protein
LATSQSAKEALAKFGWLQVKEDFFSKKNPATFWRAFKPIVSKYGDFKGEKKNVPGKLAGNFDGFFFSFLFPGKNPFV